MACIKPLRKRALPTRWLMTDPRVEAGALLAAIARLPRGAGIVFRHYQWPKAERRALFDVVRGIARRRGLVLLLAGDARLARAWGADGVHGLRGGRSRGLHSAAAHDGKEIRAAERAGADLLFLSPLYPTRSHPGGRALGRVRFAALARQARVPVIALGGVKGARGIGALGAVGFAGIDMWINEDGDPVHSRSTG